MAWYFVFLNILFAALVVGAIAGGHLWAIATQRRDWPAPQARGVPDTSVPPTAGPRRVPELLPA